VWSFTDCVSYAIIERLQIKQAAAFDVHFGQFGIVEVA
jgi:predicted nucleic acid-binding protein